MDSQNVAKTQVWLIILAVFALGGITGASLDRVYLTRANSSNPGAHSKTRGDRPSFAEVLKKDLNLTEQQMTQVKQILDDSRHNFRSVIESCEAVKVAREKTDEQLRTVLSEDQFALMKKQRAERDANRQKREQEQSKK